MKQHKLFFTGVLAVVAALLSSAAHAQASSFPTKTIRWVVVAPAGSSLDVIARAMQPKLKDLLGQAVVVENKPQAGGTLGTAEVAKSAPDGYTWVMSFNGPIAYGPHIYPKLPYQPLKDLQPVMITTSQPNVIAANVNFPANNMTSCCVPIRASTTLRRWAMAVRRT
jgi:tripartite-type tricarboxylate transporter receptor subunit TctC